MKLKDIRENLCLTQAQVGNAAGITQVSVSRIEAGHRKPAVKTAKRLAEVLKIDWTDFYEEDEADSQAGTDGPRNEG